MHATGKEVRQQKPLPAPNSDFYQLADTLTAEERALLSQVREFMEKRVAPIINKYWVEDSFPFELLPAIKELGLGGLGMQGYGCRGGGASAVWPGGDGNVSRRLVNCDILRSPQRAWPWVPSMPLARKSRSKGGSRRWPASK